MERSLHFQLHSPESSNGSGLKSGGIPQRGAFSAQMLQPQLDSPRSSAPPSALSSPQSRYEYLPDHHTPSTKRREYAHSRRSSLSQKPPSRMAGPVSGPSLAPPPPPPPRKMSSATAGAGSRHPQEQLNPNGPMRKPSVGVGNPNVHSSRSSEENSESFSAAAPTPSVHPIDTLAKKLRQQALELTTVYDELEKKNQTVQAHQTQIEELQIELEKMQSAKKVAAVAGPSSHKGTSSVAVRSRMRSSGGAAVSKSASKVALTSSHGNMKKVEELQKKIQEMEQEKKQCELSTKRVEKALSELQMHQKDRLEGVKLQAAERDDDDGREDASVAPEMLQEQRLYIRVLEEAVHLKASELHITGHEELLMVLAELRHTIYQQEQDVIEKQKQVETMQTQLRQENEQQLALRQQLDEKSTRRELEIHELRQEKANLAGQLDRTQRQLHKEQEKSLHLQECVKDADSKDTHLNEKLRSAVQLKSVAESKVENLLRSVQETKLKLERACTENEQEAQRSSTLQNDLRTKQSQVDEMKVLQDELLNNIDSYARKAEQAHQAKAQLQQRLQDALVHEQRKVKELQEVVMVKESDSQCLGAELRSVQQQLESVEAQLQAATEEKQQLETLRADERKQMEESLQEQSLLLDENKQAISVREKEWKEMEEVMREMDAVMASSLAIVTESAGQDRASEMRNDDGSDGGSEGVFVWNGNSAFRNCGDDRNADTELDGVKVCVRSLANLASADLALAARFQSYLPSFRGMVDSIREVLVGSIDHLDRVHESRSRERLDLQKACKELYATAQFCQEKMQRLQEESLSSKHKLAESSLNLEASKCKMEAMEQTIEENEREIGTLRSLEQQVFVQTRTISHQDLRIEELSSELQRFEAVERVHESELERRAQHIEQLRQRLEETTERAHHVEDLERALEDAVSLTEQQNSCNEELAAKLDETESLKSDQDERLQSFETREHAFSDRFCSLFQQYSDHLHTRSVRLSRRASSATDDGIDYENRMKMYEDEQQRGDIVRMVQIFPTLIEDFMASSDSAGSTDHRDAMRPRANSGHHYRRMRIRNGARVETSNPLSGDRRDQSVRSLAVDMFPPASAKREVLSAVSKAGRNSAEAPSPVRKPSSQAQAPDHPMDQTDDACCQEQLELIRGAFHTYRMALME